MRGKKGRERKFENIVREILISKLAGVYVKLAGEGKDGCYDENDNKKSETFESSFSTTESESEFFFQYFHNIFSYIL